jgi:hypothetical protein
MKTLSHYERETCMLQEPGWFTWVKAGKQAGIEIAYRKKLLIVQQAKSSAGSAPTVITAAFPNRVEMGLGLKREHLSSSSPREVLADWQPGESQSQGGTFLMQGVPFVFPPPSSHHYACSAVLLCLSK